MKFIANLFKGRINRRNFLIGLTIFFAESLLLIFMLEVLSRNSGSIFDLLFAVLLIFELVFIIFYWSLLVRRLHDVGMSASTLLLSLVPMAMGFVLLWLSIKAGQGDTNKYGKKPNEKIRFPADILK